MSLTLSQIQSTVRLLTQEPYPSSPIHATDANVLLLANIAQIDIASRTKSRILSNIPNSTSDTTDVTVSGQRLYSFPTGMLEIVNVTVEGDKVWYAKHEDLLKLGGTNWWKTTGKPTHYYIEDSSGTRTIGFWPTPGAVYNIEMFGVKLPTAMSASGSYPDLDERLHISVVYQVCAEVMRIRRENDRAREWDRKCEESIDRYMRSAMDTNEGGYFLSPPTPSD